MKEKKTTESKMSFLSYLLLVCDVCVGFVIEKEKYILVATALSRLMQRRVSMLVLTIYICTFRYHCLQYLKMGKGKVERWMGR
jgi:hypothetical protein